ncbi:MAG: hypothetical protein CMI26_10255 [Opitutae bacterium]|nr:hypothetical protein [Opitutae bacterium]|tara:strand:+ start:3863 stop:4423 length:561 start_codon:yes stop_codon:yes gene_type:complete
MNSIKVCFLSFLFFQGSLFSQDNPFLPPGAKNARPPAPVVRQLPVAPKPKPVNPNLELRGIFRYREVWHFNVHDKVKNKGYWITPGDALTEANIEVESFDEANDVLKLKGGMSLSLRESAGKTLSVPGQGKPKAITKKPPANRVSFPGKSGARRTVTIPPRIPSRAPVKPPSSSAGRPRLVVPKKP